jgi:hypothetical protein
MTEKDRPRKKDWKREYERGREPGRYNNDTRSGSFFLGLSSPDKSNTFFVHNE